MSEAAVLAKGLDGGEHSREGISNVGFADVDRTLARGRTLRIGREPGIAGLLRGTRLEEGYILPSWTEYLAERKREIREHADRMRRVEEDIHKGAFSFLEGASKIFDIYLAAVHGMSFDEAVQYAEEFADQVETYPHTKELFGTMSEHEFRMYSLTANPEELMRGIARRWEREGINLSIGITTKIRRDAQGRFNGKILWRPLTGLEKRFMLSKFARDNGIDLSRSICFGDSPFSDGASLALVGKGYLVSANGESEPDKLWGIEPYGREALISHLERKEETTQDRVRDEPRIRRVKTGDVRRFAQRYVDATDLVSLLQIAAQAPFSEDVREKLLAEANDMADALLERGDYRKKGLRDRVSYMASRFQEALRGLPPDVYMKEMRTGSSGITHRGTPLSSVVGRMYPFPYRSGGLYNFVDRAVNNFHPNRGRTERRIS
ncbi:MAG: haloacid dehalogenase-like hydrolase [Candidatus Aenigmarchaeota archaeon]|nr:haloacid dehalogenase-like hydrolase [Candidatus Aenigmarchaeota archaeon]